MFERNQNQLVSNNFLNFSYGLSSAKTSNWERSKKLMKKSENNKEKSKDQPKETPNKTKQNKQQVTISPTTNTTTKITITSSTKLSPNKSQLNKFNKLIRSNSGLYLASSNKPPSPMSPTGGVRRKLANPQSILKKQMSIDSLTAHTANMNLDNDQKVKSTNLSPNKQSKRFDGFLQPFDLKKRKPTSAPSTVDRTNSELV